MNKKLFTSYLCNENDVILQEILDEWKSLNPEYEVLYFSDSDVEEFFKDTPQYETYSKMRNGVAIADFFRICYINKFGGYWFDLGTGANNLSGVVYPNSSDQTLLFMRPGSWDRNTTKSYLQHSDFDGNSYIYFSATYRT